MRDEQLKYVLERIDLDECEEVVGNHIYYIRKAIRQRYDKYDKGYGYTTDEYEFLVIAQNSEKQGIILRCGYGDLHWYILKKSREKGVLSKALRTGIIRKVWPENVKITCCYNFCDNREQKYNMTKHLADIAGLHLEN